MRGVFLLLCLTLTFVESHYLRYRGPRFINLGVVGILRPRFIRGPGRGLTDIRTLRSGGTSISSVRGPSFVSRTTRVSTLGDIDGGFGVRGPAGARFVTSSTYRPRISLAGAPGSIAPGVSYEDVFDGANGVGATVDPVIPGTSVGQLPGFTFTDDSTSDGVPGGLVPGGSPSVVTSVGTSGPLSGYTEGSYPLSGYTEGSYPYRDPVGPGSPGPLSGYTDGSYVYQDPVGPGGRGRLSVRGSAALHPGYTDIKGALGPIDKGTSYDDVFGDNDISYDIGSHAGIRSVNTGSTSALRSFAYETSPTYRRIDFVGRPRVVSVRRSTYGDSSLYGTDTDDYVDAATSLGGTRGGRIISEAEAYGRGSHSGGVLYGPSSSSYLISDATIPYKTSDRY